MAEYAGIPAPNDNHGNENTLSIDGSVITKLVSVGGDVEVQAMTRGHTSETVSYTHLTLPTIYSV